MVDVNGRAPDAVSKVLARDVGFLRQTLAVFRPVCKLWHRSEVRGLKHIPDGGSLVVSNHSGGMMAMDFPVFAVDFYERFGFARELYLLSHGVLFDSPLAEPLRKMGLVLADPEIAQTILESGATLMVFPGGDYDAARPTSRINQIDFRGRTGYVKTALRADVPIVPMVSIGGHENQFYLTRGEGLAKLLGLKAKTKMSILPLSFGFPFGPSLLFPVNIPLPTKIVTQVLEPLDVRAQFGDDADPKVVDAHIRKVMQASLDELAKQRRLPIIG